MTEQKSWQCSLSLVSLIISTFCFCYGSSSELATCRDHWSWGLVKQSSSALCCGPGSPFIFYISWINAQIILLYLQLITYHLFLLFSLHWARKNSTVIAAPNMQDLVAHQLGMELLLSWGHSESPATGQGLSSTSLHGTEVPETTFVFCP